MLNRQIAASLLLATPVMAQTGVVVVPAAEIAQRLSTVPTSTTITTTGSYISLFSHRTVDGTPERHANWTDVMVMLHGEVTVTTGGAISGNTVDANGESHGGTITGGTTVTLHAGDYLQVPAGVPHLMTAPKDDFRYFVTKVHI
jgi:mannose-6-phosphate isomerase-like protein (cupin superfamily)